MVNWRVRDKFPLGTRLEGCMPISAWLDKGRILSEFDRNEKNIIHLSKKRSKFFAVYFTLTTFAFVRTYLRYNPILEKKSRIDRISITLTFLCIASTRLQY